MTPNQPLTPDRATLDADPDEAIAWAEGESELTLREFVYGREA